MARINVDDKIEFIDSPEKFLQLVEDYMGKDSVKYIEDNFGYSKCDNCEKINDLESENEDLSWEIEQLKEEIEELSEND